MEEGWEGFLEDAGRPVIVQGQRLRTGAAQQGPWGSFSFPSSSEVTHVVMEGTSAKEAICWQKNMDAPLPGRPQPALLDISWFTESMASGQPVPEEVRHRLEVSWDR